MIVINLRFLAGRFHATPWGHHVNEGVVEWPPSPWRLLRALVATFYRVQPEVVVEEQLRHILAVLAEPPSFHLPPATTAHTRHYDTANDGVKFFDAFVALDPTATVLWVWPDAELSGEDRCALAALLDALGTLGRAESWCEAALLTEDVVAELNSLPLADGQSLAGLEPVRVLMPEADNVDLLTSLTVETATLRKQKQLAPPGARWVTYTRPVDALTVRWAAPPQPARVQPTVARYALDSTVLPLVQNALPFAEQVRRALIRNRVDTSHSETITGKTADGVPLEGHMHAHYLATDEDLDDRIDHMTIYVPCGFDPSDVVVLGQLTRIFRSGNQSEVRLVLTGLGEWEQFADVPLFMPSHRWRSITPFSLPRFATRGGGKPSRPRDLPEAQLMRELRLRGLPEPISIKRVEGYGASGRPPVRWLEFQTRRYLFNNPGRG